MRVVQRARLWVEHLDGQPIWVRYSDEASLSIRWIVAHFAVLGVSYAFWDLGMAAVVEPVHVHRSIGPSRSER